MILWRNADVDAPFLWASDRQPAGRWHGPGEGPVGYTSTSPDTAWAEFLRHAGITDPADLEGVERSMWVLEVADDEAAAEPDLEPGVLTGGPSAYAACQAEARRLRAAGATRIAAPSAAIEPGAPLGWLSDPDLRPGPAGRQATVALVGPRPGQRGHLAAHAGRPHPSLLALVRPL